MKLEKPFLIIALIAIALAVPVAFAMQSRTKVHKSEVQHLQIEKQDATQKLQIKTKEAEQKQQEVLKQQQEADKLKQENEKLKADLQAKLKRQEQAKLAAAQARTAPVSASGGSAVDCNLARNLINQYDWNRDVAYKVMLAESSCNARNQNYGDYHSFANCRGSFGLFQINCSHGQVFDPAKNVAIAYSMWKSSGWGPWSATTCRYKVACY